MGACSALGLALPSRRELLLLWGKLLARLPRSFIMRYNDCIILRCIQDLQSLSLLAHSLEPLVRGSSSRGRCGDRPGTSLQNIFGKIRFIQRELPGEKIQIGLEIRAGKLSSVDVLCLGPQVLCVALAGLGFPQGECPKRRRQWNLCLWKIWRHFCCLPARAVTSLPTVVSGHGDMHRCAAGCGPSGKVVCKLYPF